MQKSQPLWGSFNAFNQPSNDGLLALVGKNTQPEKQAAKKDAPKKEVKDHE